MIHFNITLLVYSKDFKNGIQNIGGVMLRGLEDKSLIRNSLIIN
jgi:hypothetical protein